MTRARKVGLLLLALLVAGGVYGVWRQTRMKWIDAGYAGVIFDANRGLIRQAIPPKRIQIGLRQSLYTYPTGVKFAIYTQDPEEGEVKAADGIAVTTAENAITTFDVAVLYHVEPENIPKVFDSFGPIPIEEIQSNHIRRAVKEATNAVGVKYDVFQLMGEKRKEASQAITEELKKVLAPKGLTVEMALICGAYPSPDIQSKINSRVNAFTSLGIASLKNQAAELERETVMVQARASSQAAKMRAAKATSRSNEVLALEADELAISRWNGHLASIEPRTGQTLVLGQGIEALLGPAVKQSAETQPAEEQPAETQPAEEQPAEEQP